MAKAIRVGFMGAGWPCQRHAEGFLTLKGIELAAIADPLAERRTAFVDAYGKMQQFDTYQEMLAKGGLDAVIVGLPTGMHTEGCLAAFAAGAHVLCEKPPTTNAADMIRIARVAKKTGLTYMFGRQPRFAPWSLHARKIVADGKIGRVYHAEGKWIRARGIPWGAGGWFVNKQKGGGVLLDLGVHAIDNAWFVMGCPQPVEVFSGLHCAFSYLAPKGVEYNAEDAAIGMIRFEDGATLHFMVTFALNIRDRDPKASDGISKPAWQETTIYGTKGGIDVMGGKVIAGKDKEVLVKSMKSATAVHKAAERFPKFGPTFAVQAREFVRAVRTGDTPISSAAQAVMLMQMLEALRKSGETGRAVRIRPVK